MKTREKIQVTKGLRCIVLVIVIEKKKRKKKIQVTKGLRCIVIVIVIEKKKRKKKIFDSVHCHTTVLKYFGFLKKFCMLCV